MDSRAENGLTALHMAAALGDVECVQALLGAGASMMVRTVDLDMSSAFQFPAGSTPLHLAAQRGHIAILQAMLQVLPQFLAPCAYSPSLHEAPSQWLFVDSSLHLPCFGAPPASATAAHRTLYVSYLHPWVEQKNLLGMMCVR